MGKEVKALFASGGCGTPSTEMRGIFPERLWINE
jgi:hypothetical protein